MSNVIFAGREKRFKSAFKKYHDKIYKSVQFKPVVLNGDPYVLYGEQRLSYVPLISHFDVYDQYAKSADESPAQIVHDFVEKLYLTISMIKSWHTNLRKLSDITVTGAQIEDQFTFSSSEEANVLAETITDSLLRMEQLFEVTELISAKEQWDQDDINEFNEAWHAFWAVFEARVQALLDLYRHNKTVNIKSSEDSWAQSLHDEASRVYDNLKQLTPLNESVGAHSIDALIKHNYTYGRLTQADEPLKKNYKLERGLYGVMLLVYRVVAWFLIPIIFLALWSEGELSLYALVPLLLFIIVSKSLINQNKYRLLIKNTTDLLEQRARTVSDKQTNLKKKENMVPFREQAATTVKEETKPKPKVLFETRAIVMTYVYIISLFTGLILAVSISVVFDDPHMGKTFLTYMVLVNIVLIAMTLIYPLTSLSKRKVKLTDHAMVVRKDKYGPSELTRVEVKRNKKMAAFYLTYHHAPYKLRIEAADFNTFVDHLKIWSKNNDIPFEDKAN